MRSLVRLFKPLAVLLGIAGLAGYLYLLSPACARRVADQLAEIYGGPVGLSAFWPGVASQTFAGLKLHEAGPNAASEPWLSGDLTANVSLWDLLRGEPHPTVLTLNSPQLIVRLDREGEVITQLPLGEEAEGGGTPPTIALQDARVTVYQQGHPEFRVEGVSLELRPEGDQLVLAGRVTDPRWGNWELAGLFPPKGDGSVALKTGKCRITQPMLDSLPFVPPQVWKEVQAEGDASCVVNVRIPQGEPVRYRVELELEGARVHVTAIDLHADRAQGRVVVEDGLVQLRNLTGRAAAGKLDVTGDLDFRAPTCKLEFKLDAQRLDLRGLPLSWALPEQIQGRLSGKANLQLTIAPERVSTFGEGHGTIHDVQIAGIPAPLPIRLRLGAEGERFRFFIPKFLLPGRAVQ